MEATKSDSLIITEEVPDTGTWDDGMGREKG